MRIHGKVNSKPDSVVNEDDDDDNENIEDITGNDELDSIRYLVEDVISVVVVEIVVEWIDADVKVFIIQGAQ